MISDPCLGPCRSLKAIICLTGHSLSLRRDLHRWFLESDLDAEDLAKATIRALDAWMDQEILDIDFEPEDED